MTWHDLVDSVLLFVLIFGIVLIAYALCLVSFQ